MPSVPSQLLNQFFKLFVSPSEETLHRIPPESRSSFILFMDTLSDIFTPRDYQLTPFEYKDVSLHFYSLHSASTDFDLTGQIVWPSAVELAKFIIDHRELLAGKRAIELGAGAGLCGFVAAKFCKEIYITDGNEVVQDLISQNVKHLALQNCVSQHFLWSEENAKQFKEVEIVIGADIIFWQQSVQGLIDVLKYFFEQNKDLKVLVGGMKRYQLVEDEIDNKLQELGRKRTVLQQINEYKQPVYIYEIK